ncbi:MAG: hypothetical protein COA58_14310 [Bacteroidetes bacterium]|nr:MAG: hypothetical protein COA58_14310 [Bacteroidota bacterium]
MGLTEEKEPSFPRFDSTTKTIHILVALCDNENQGIVPVPAMIGNGQDPRNNLYWGAGFGIKTYFKRSKEWEFIESRKVSSVILERIIFKHKITGHFLVADAYDGRYIKQTTLDLLQSSAGLSKDTVMVNNQAIGIHGNANLVAYIGHDGLMDFELNQQFVNQDSLKRDVIILACFSKHYFNPLLSKANVNPLVWTTGLMAPEAYTIHDALSGYVLGETNEEIRLRAAMAYANYQKCSLRAAKNLLVTKNQK